MGHSRPLVWQPAYCTCGTLPNAIVLDTDFAKRCARIVLSDADQHELHQAVMARMHRTGALTTEVRFEFVDESLLLASVAETPLQAHRLELQRLAWKGEKTNHHPVYAFADSGDEIDQTSRLSLQGAFAWWAQYAASLLSKMVRQTV